MSPFISVVVDARLMHYQRIMNIVIIVAETVYCIWFQHHCQTLDLRLIDP